MRVRLSGLIAEPFRELHRDILAGENREYWLKGGRGSGKSSFIALEILLGLLADREVNAIVYRKVAATLRESVYEQLLWAAEKLGIAGNIRARAQPLELCYRPTGQRILFRGADDPGKSKSLKIAQGRFGFLWLEELTEFASMDDVRSIKASVLRGEGRSVTFASYNPPMSPANWVNEEVLRPVLGRKIHMSDYRDLPREWLGEGFLREAEALRELDMRRYRHMYLGEVTGSGEEVFENLCLRRIENREIEALDGGFAGLDFGFAADPDAFVRMDYDRKRARLVIVDEFVGYRMDAQSLAEEIKRRARGARLTCDSAEPRAIYALRECGVAATTAKKGPGSVRRGMRFLQELTEIVIDPARCPVAAREFSSYAYARDASGRPNGAYPDRDNHTIDAVRYALESEILSRNAKTFERERMGI